ncbi:MAG: hypothetical protein M0R77_00660 [Gammaproteobacteria bacterium]|nr:hypothetical protein [Acholeplasmataceae bacterium]MCK9529065.1 hypothetical protein [Gammaproteobacteria bacterium]
MKSGSVKYFIIDPISRRIYLRIAWSITQLLTRNRYGVVTDGEFIYSLGGYIGGTTANVGMLKIKPYASDHISSLALTNPFTLPSWNGFVFDNHLYAISDQVMDVVNLSTNTKVYKNIIMPRNPVLRVLHKNYIYSILPRVDLTKPDRIKLISKYNLLDETIEYIELDEEWEFNDAGGGVWGRGCSLGDDIYFIAGNSTIGASFYKYNDVTNKVTEIPVPDPFNMWLSSTSCFPCVLNGKIYFYSFIVIGDVPEARIWEYTPEE